jgi:ABC-type transport system involved in multi-copper enzyme maturation permease subunit
MPSLRTRLDRFSAFAQSRRGKVVLTVLSALLIVGAAMPLLLAAARAQALRFRMQTELAVIDLDERSPEAIALLERGELTIGELSYGGPRVKAMVPRMADAQGRLVGVDDLARVLVSPTLPPWAPAGLVQSLENCLALVSALLVLSIGCIWSGLAMHLVVISVLAGLSSAVSVWFGQVPLALALVGIGALALSFLLVVGVLGALLSGASPVFAIAATVMREAQRQRISVAFIGLLLVVLPILPLSIDPASPLRYQIQTFISRGCGLVFSVASVMTLLLACSTVAFEMRDRQIWQLLTKPVSRAQYMLGKWLGIMAVNTSILLVGATCIVAYVQYLSLRPAADPLDARAVREEVLVARQGRLAEYESLQPERLVEMVDQAIESDPVLKAEIDSGERDLYETRIKLAEERITAFGSQQRAVPAGQGKAFTFRNVSVPRGTEQVTLRYEFHLGQDDSHEQHPVIFRFADGSWVDKQFVPVQANVLPIPAELIDANGDLTVEIMSLGFDGTNFTPGEGTIVFDPDGIEILYAVGSFGGNFARAMGVQWTKLAFLAMLGVASATILSFGVACLLAFTIFVAAQLAPFIQISVEQYRIAEETPVVLQWVQLVIKGIAFTSQWLLGAFGATKPVDALVDGRSIGLTALVQSALFIGIGWTGLALALGWLGFRRKELAIYSGVG